MATNEPLSITVNKMLLEENNELKRQWGELKTIYERFYNTLLTEHEMNNNLEDIDDLIFKKLDDLIDRKNELEQQRISTIEDLSATLALLRTGSAPDGLYPSTEYWLRHKCSLAASEIDGRIKCLIKREV